jgi:hypothetical protein
MIKKGTFRAKTGKKYRFKAVLQQKKACSHIGMPEAGPGFAGCG